MLPPRAPGTALRVLATNDMLGSVVPLPTTYGLSGTCHGVRELLEQELERGPALWLDSGDLSVGGPGTLFGDAVLDDLAALPIAAAAAGNHEFDQGPAALLRNAARLPFPLLCLDRDAGLPGDVLLDTPAGALGVIGITHPSAHELSQAPAPVAELASEVAATAAGLRGDGARWVIALFHDGVTWWGHERSISTRPHPLATSTRPWIAHVDAVLCGHTLGSWTGSIDGVPAGHASPYATTVLAVDLPSAPARPLLHAPTRVPPVRGATESQGAAAIDTAAASVVGDLSATWTSAAITERFLPDLVARAIRDATGADAGFVPSSQLFTQAPLDGCVAALQAGPVTALDLQRIFPFECDDVVVVELRPGEVELLARVHDVATAPRNPDTDGLWWNWSRLRAGVAGDVARASTLAVDRYFVPLVASLVERDVGFGPTEAGGRAALRLTTAG